MVLSAFGSVAYGATATSITVMTDHPHYSGTALVKLAGFVQPFPQTGNVRIVITAPNGAPSLPPVTVPLRTAHGVTGVFAWEFMTSGVGFKTSGTYTVTAQLVGSNLQGTTTFTYSP